MLIVPADVPLANQLMRANWVRRITKPQGASALLPGRVASVIVEAAISLRSERGWRWTFPSDVPAN